jgi:hypothetical protein
VTGEYFLTRLPVLRYDYPRSSAYVHQRFHQRGGLALELHHQHKRRRHEYGHRRFTRRQILEFSTNHVLPGPAGVVSCEHNLASAAGVERIQFIRRDFDSLLGNSIFPKQTFSPSPRSLTARTFLNGISV